MLASTADRLFLVYHAHHFDNVVFDRVYYAFDSRADALFLGCLLGLLAADGYLHGWARWARGLITVGRRRRPRCSCAGSCCTRRSTPRTSACGGCPPPPWRPRSSSPTSSSARRASAPSSSGSGFLVFIGDLSYTVYLIHFPVYLAIQQQQTGWAFWPNELLRLVIIFSIAIASWFLIERPLMRWRQRSAASRGAS